MMKITLKLKSSFYKTLLIGMIGGGCFAQTDAVSMFKSSMKPEEITHVHQMLKDKMLHSQHQEEKESLKGMLLKFEKYYITPDDYTLEVSIQDDKGETLSLNIIGTTNENKRFSLETPCEAKGTLNGERLYIQPKLDINKTGELCLKVSVVLGRQEFLVIVPYKNEMEIKDEQKAVSGSLKIHAKLKIKRRGFWR